MQTKLLPLLFLLGAAAPSLGSPITPAASSSPSAPPATNTLDDVHVQCPDENSENSYDTCLSRNADQQCSSMGDLPEQAACQVLWEYTCGKFSPLHLLYPLYALLSCLIFMAALICDLWAISVVIAITRRAYCWSYGG
ncbi:hypothetical protein K449DRAFT_429990 [Hypoxylon sp. EC38]|nr:hypothetical protein K449DRAFT_429990 [Hypoxylon sp. EC38]